MNSLDDLKLVDSLDPEGMGRLIAGFADQCRAAWRNVSSFELPLAYRDAQNLLILGMGGSAIGGDLLRTLVAAECRIPIVVSREYSIPAWANAKTLAIASSHSGNTEETLSSLNEARSRGCMLAGVTTGGELEGLNSIPLLKYEFDSQPRAALAYSFVSLLGILAHLGWITDPKDNLDQALVLVEELDKNIGLGTAAKENRAKELATKLYGRIPVIYAGGVLGEVAHRWKTQVNENSKSTAFYDVMSELNHNSVVGYEFPKEVLARFIFVLLRSKRADARIQKRFAVTQRLLAKRDLEPVEVNVVGQTALQEMLWAIHYGDYVSYYLAILNGIDPTPVQAIDMLKSALRT